MSSNADNKYELFKLAIPVLRVSLQILGGTLALAAIILAFLVWRMSDGPVSLNFLRPHLEQLFNAEDSPIRVSFENLEATWTGWEPYVVLNASNLSVTKANRDANAIAEVLSAQLSVPSILQGHIKFTRLYITGLNLQISKSATKPTPEITTKPLFDDYVQSSLVNLSQTIAETIPEGLPEFSHTRIEELRVFNSQLEMLNSSNLPIWKINSDQWHLTHLDQGVDVSLPFILNIENKKCNISLKANYSQGRETWETELSFSDFAPNQFPLVSRHLENVVDLKTTLSGSFVTSFDTIYNINEIKFTISSTAGSASFPDKSMFFGDYTIKNMRMAGHITTQAPSIFMDSFEGTLNETEIYGSASLTNLYSNPRINAAFDAHQIPVNQLSRIWPQNLATGTRRWVLENISGGILEDITAYVDFPLSDLQKDKLERNQIFGQFRVSNTTVEYIDSLPPAHNLFADGWFDGVDLHIAIEKGEILDQEIHGTTVEFLDVYTGKEIGLLDFRSTGPLSDLSIFPGFSPKFISWLSSPENKEIGGFGNATLTVHFPLISGLGVQDLEITGEVAFEDFSLLRKQQIFGSSEINISDSSGVLFLADSVLRGSAEGLVNQIPVEVKWATAPNSRPSDLIGNATIRSTIGSDFIASLTNFFPFANGEATVEINIDALPEDRQNTLINIDASNLGISSPSINFEKKSGEPLNISGGLHLESWKPSSPITLDIRGQYLEGSATAELDTNNNITKLSVKNISYQKEKIAADILFENNEINEINARAKSLTLDLLKSTGKASNLKLRKGYLSVERLAAGEMTTFSDAQIQYSAPAQDSVKVRVDSKDLNISQSLISLLDTVQEATTATDNGTVDISGKVENFYSSEGNVLHNVQGKISIQDGQLIRARIQGFFNDEEEIRVEIAGSGERQKITIASENAGEFLKLLGITSNLVGGKLYLEASYGNNSNENMLEGQCIVENFHLTNTPIIAQLLSMSLPTNVFELLAGKGVPFARLSAPFRYEESSLELLKARATGVSLGITVDGKIDLISNAADIQGTIIPAYLLNNLVGTVPVIGDILTGPEKEGIFAAHYSAKGPTDDLKIFVNPLTVLAPGILRDLFNLFAPDSTQPTRSKTAP